MKKSFIDFVIERYQNIENKKLILEAFQEKDIEKALDLIDSILKKHIHGLLPLAGFVNTLIDGKECLSKQYIVYSKDEKYKASSFQLNWLLDGKSADVYSIDFFKDLTVYWSGEGKADLSIFTLGTSVMKFLPIIWSVVNSNNYKLEQSEAEKLASSVYKDVKESKYSVGAIEYHILEGLSKDIIKEAFIVETKATELKKAKSAEIKLAKQTNVGEEELKRLKEEYSNICEAIKSGSETVDDVKMSIANGKPVKVKLDDTLKEADEEVEAAKKDPDQVFKEMSKYINLVIKGLQPSLILCGAPGTGKTYRVKKQLKTNGYKEGLNMNTIKGKCTARRLYLALFEMKKKQQITVIDDADSLVGPKASEDCINILKAALDSSEDDEGRLVTYGVSGKLLDDDGNEIPKKFYYNGGVIVITNYQAGSLDTALRGRSFIQDIHFDNKDILSIVKKLMPTISPDLFSAKSKLKAYDYLEELNDKGSEMELSIRTFALCAKIFEACNDDDDFSDDDARSMIEEQMKLQYARARGEKY